MLPEFDLKIPTTLSEALFYVKENPAAVPIAGGTNLVVDMRSRRKTPPVVVDIGRLAELTGIFIENGSVRIGAAVTISQILESRLLGEKCPLIQQAAAVFANPLIRNRATIGGNLADSSPAADMAPPLLALDAMVGIVSDHGMRKISMVDFYQGLRRTAIQEHELLYALWIPIMESSRRSGFYKIGLRRADAIAVVSAAVSIQLSGTGLIESTRLAFGSVAPTPYRAFAAENFMLGKKITSSVVHDAGCLAAEAANPISDLRGSEDYRRKMVSVLTEKLLNNLRTPDQED